MKTLNLVKDYFTPYIPTPNRCQIVLEILKNGSHVIQHNILYSKLLFLTHYINQLLFVDTLYPPLKIVIL